MPCGAFADELITGKGLPEDYIEVKAKKVTSGPTLIFSDSPEMVYKNGVFSTTSMQWTAIKKWRCY